MVNLRMFVKTCKCFSYQCYMEILVFVLIFAHCVKIIKINDKKKLFTIKVYMPTVQFAEVPSKFSISNNCCVFAMMVI